MSMKKNLYQVKDAAFSDAFDRAVVNIHLRKQETGSRAFIVCGCEPGVGTTTIAINLAIAMATSGWKTVLIDADMRKARELKRLSEEQDHLSGYLGGEMEARDIICPTNHENLSYISSGTPSVSTIRLLCKPRMKELLDGLKNEYDYVIIDAPAPLASVDACILTAHSDGIVMVARWDHTTVDQIRATREELKVRDAEILGVIVNGMDMPSYRRSRSSFFSSANSRQENSERERKPLPPIRVNKERGAQADENE